MPSLTIGVRIRRGGGAHASSGRQTTQRTPLGHSENESSPAVQSRKADGFFAAQPIAEITRCSPTHYLQLEGIACARQAAV